MTIPKRPQWNHPEAKSLAAKECIDDVRAWASKYGAADGNDKEFLVALTLAMIEGCDGYAAGRYLEDVFGWKVNGELIRILDAAFRRAKFLVTPLTHEWVMKHNVRFPAKKGEKILFRIGDAEFKGKVVTVITREARAVVEILGKPDKHLQVNGEEVVKTIKTGSAGGPGDFPTGGTPIAGAMEDPAKKKVVNG